MRRGGQAALDALFVVTEALPWFMAVLTLGTLAERAFLTEIERRIEFEVVALAGSGGGPARSVLAEVRDAIDTVTVGPSLLVVLIAALGAFALMRALRTRRITGPLGGIVLLLSTVVMLNVLLHVTIAGDLQIWDNAGLARFIDDPATEFPDQLDLQRFIDSPAIGRPHGTARALALMGLLAVWVRFLVAGRSVVRFERVLRSFTIGFVASLVILAIAGLGGIGGLAPFAIGHFIIGMLVLAVAHGARAQLPVDDVRRSGPWAASVMVTMAGLIAIAGVLGFFVLVDVQPVLEWVSGPVGRVIEWLLILVLTPIVRIVIFIASFFIDENATRTQEFGPQEGGEPPPENESGGIDIPDALLDGGKVVVLAIALYLAFRLAVRLLNRRPPADPDELAEERETERAAVGLGGLLRSLLPRGGRTGSGQDWMRRHAIYALFGRAVRDATERGLRRRDGETPLEFAAVGERMLGADMLPEIADAFDAARYGRHFPGDDAVRALAERLEEWERAHPPSDAMRARIAGARQPSETERIRVQIELTKRAARGDPRARRL